MRRGEMAFLVKVRFGDLDPLRAAGSVGIWDGVADVEQER
jgi:hypothetical protein